MQPIRIAIVTAVITAILAGIWLVFSWQHPPTLLPAVSMHLVGYMTFTKDNPDTNVLVYPERGSWLKAQMVLTNEGPVTIAYAAWGNEPYGWASVQTDQGTTNGYLAPRFTGGTKILRPGCAANFWVILPTNTLQWQCGFDVESASLRERAIWRVLESKFYRKIPELLFFPVRLLPNKPGPSLEVKSELIEVSNSVNSQSVQK